MESASISNKIKVINVIKDLLSSFLASCGHRIKEKQSTVGLIATPRSTPIDSLVLVE
jgi:hypothetical protein